MDRWTDRDQDEESSGTKQAPMGRVAMQGMSAFVKAAPTTSVQPDHPLATVVPSRREQVI